MADRLEFIIRARDKFSKTMGSLTKMLPSLKTSALATSAAVAGLGTALFAMTKSTATAFDAVQKFSDQLGLSTEFLSSMQHAAELSGVQVNTMNKSLQMLQVRIGEANRGIGQGKDAFEGLGISVKDSNGVLRNAETILPELAESFKNMASETERAEYASKIFGQRGIAMLQIFKDGERGLKAMTDEAARFGLVVDSEAGRKAAEFNDSLTRLTASFTGIKNAIAVDLMPEITRVAEELAEWIANNREMLSQDVVGWLRDVAKMVKAVGDSLKWIDDNLTDRVLDLLFGKAERLSKMDMLLKRLKEEQFILDDLKELAFDSNLIDKKRIDLKQATVDMIKQEIAELRESKQSTVELAEATENLIRTQVKQIGLMGTLRVPDSLDEALSGFFDSLDTADIGQIVADQVEASIQQIEDAEARHLEYKRTQYADFYAWQNEMRQLGFEQEELLWANFLEVQTEGLAVTSENIAAVSATQMEGVAAVAQGTMGLVNAFGKKAFAAQKAVSVAQATINAYEAFTVNQKAYPEPFGSIMGAIAKALALVQVAKMVAIGPQGAAHGGLTSVPREQTYLLDRGERVLSPQQNEDLTAFLQGAGGGASVENMVVNVEVLPNATNAGALLDIDERVFEEIVEEKIVPALSRLKGSGITP